MRTGVLEAPWQHPLNVCADAVGLQQAAAEYLVRQVRNEFVSGLKLMSEGLGNAAVGFAAGSQALADAGREGDWGLLVAHSHVFVYVFAALREPALLEEVEAILKL